MGVKLEEPPSKTSLVAKESLCRTDMVTAGFFVPRRIAKTKTARTSHVRGCWALICIDSRPIRQKALQEYQKAWRALEEARLQLAQYNEQDKPRFFQWLNRSFGALLTELRETGHQLQTQRALVYEVEAEAFWSDRSFANAYERVLRRRDKPEPDPSATGENPPDADPGLGGDSDPFADFQDAFADHDDLDEEDFGSRSGRSQTRARTERSGKAASDLKELYRALARRLHPDGKEEMSVQEKEWWHQTQAAYQQGDVEQLRTILTLCEIRRQGTTDQTSVSGLLRLTQQFRSSLRSLKAELGGCRHDPAWNFSRSGDLSVLRRRIERELQGELLALKQALSAVEGQLASWARQAALAKSRPRRRRSQPDSECWF
jgi:hypothetical protein